MSTSSLGLNPATSGAPISVSGLASGLETSRIIAALMGVEREPLTHLSSEQQKLQSEQSQLQGIQASLQRLAAVTSEFSAPSLFESSQTATSNEPARVSAVVSSGAGVGGYEVEVTQLANSAQRTFAFTSPASEQTVTIDGHEFELQTGESAKQFASAINSNKTATVYAAVVEGEVVLSNRVTGKTGGEFIKVTGAALKEKAGSEREGKEAEFTVDGVEGKSSSNTVTNAIAGVTLTLGGLTPQGPVTIDVQAPGANVGAIEAQVKAFVGAYNSTVELIQAKLATRAPANPRSAEPGVGALFGDLELTSMLDNMRVAMYEPISGLEAGMSSPFDIGISTGAPAGEAVSSQSSLEGLLTLDPAKLAEAVAANPTGAQKMLQTWSGQLQSQIEVAANAGGSLDSRITGDGEQISQLTRQINSMNETLAVREKGLQATYARLEGVISRNSAQSSWLATQAEALSNSKP